MKCPKCNFDVPENNKFCPECGERMSEILKDETQEAPTQETLTQEASTPDTANKKAKNKKVKKILIISISAVVACGLIFLILFLINPSCMFGHRNVHVEGNEPTCTIGGYQSGICDDCKETIWTDTFSALDHSYGYPGIACLRCGVNRSCEEAYLEHTFENVVCGAMNTCTTCGTQKKLDHSFAGLACEYCGEMKYNISIEELPITVHTYNSNGSKKQSCVVTNISYNIDYSRIKVSYTLKSTYHEKGNNYSAQAKFGWKLYDADGTVVDSGTAYSDGTVNVGEQSKGYFYTYNVEPFVEYKLEILNLR